MKPQPKDPESQRSAKPKHRQDDVKPDTAEGLLTDAELTDLALAADPDAGVAADAVPIDEVLSSEDERDADDLLPSWYMPRVSGGSIYGWRRRVVLLIVISFVVTAAYGICSTYGLLGL